MRFVMIAGGIDGNAPLEWHLHIPRILIMVEVRGAGWQHAIWQRAFERPLSPCDGWALQAIPQLHGTDWSSRHLHGLPPERENEKTAAWMTKATQARILQTVLGDRNFGPSIIERVAFFVWVTEFYSKSQKPAVPEKV